MFKYKWLSGLFALFSAIYLILAVFSSTDKAVLTKYHISETQAITLTLTVAIPYVVIWLIALGGYTRFKNYTEAIQNTKDGAAFATIAQGILLLTLWLPFSAVLSSLTTRYYHLHPDMTAGLVWLDNYANLVMLFPAFWLVNRGSQRLLKLVKQHAYQFPQKASIIFISLTAIYVLLTLQDPARRIPTDSVPVASYYLPDWAIVLTIIIPRLIMWYLGVQAVFFIYLYQRKVKGALYKAALRNLAHGLGWVVMTIVTLRFFQSLSTQLSGLNLGLILLVVYALLILIASGYSLIARGAKSLQRIEEL